MTAEVPPRCFSHSVRSSSRTRLAAALGVDGVGTAPPSAAPERRRLGCPAGRSFLEG